MYRSRLVVVFLTKTMASTNMLIEDLSFVFTPSMSVVVLSIYLQC